MKLSRSGRKPKKLDSLNKTDRLRFSKRRKINGTAERVISDLPNNELPEMILDKTLVNTMRYFVKFSAEKLQKSIWRLGVRHSGDLYESMRTSVTTGSSKTSGTISFNWYGRFVDMGVGNGLTLIEKQTGRALTTNRNPSRITRKPKPWLTDVWPGQVHRMSEILARDIAIATLENIKQNLPEGKLILPV